MRTLRLLVWVAAVNACATSGAQPDILVDAGGTATEGAAGAGPGPGPGTGTGTGAGGSVTPRGSGGAGSGGSNSPSTGGTGGTTPTTTTDARPIVSSTADVGTPDRSAPTAPLPSDAGGVVVRSQGCGKPATGTSTYVRRTLMIQGVEREYYLFLPKTYDPNRAYPLVFRWHGSTGNGISGGLEIESASKENAIIASGSGRNGEWTYSATGPDVAFFDTMLSNLSDELCVDRRRIFSFGFSAGAYMSHLLACIRGNVVRAIAPVAGALLGNNTCVGRVAAWMVHSIEDKAVPISTGMAARDRIAKANACAATTMPVAPSTCVAYDGCAPDLPVVWCQITGPHGLTGLGFIHAGAWKFFEALK